MALETTPWDSAEYLKSEAQVAAYLNACFEEAGDDPVFLAHALGIAARACGMSKQARDAGLNEALADDGGPSFRAVIEVVNALGYRFALTDNALAQV